MDRNIIAIPTLQRMPDKIPTMRCGKKMIEETQLGNGPYLKNGATFFKLKLAWAVASTSTVNADERQSSLLILVHPCT